MAKGSELDKVMYGWAMPKSTFKPTKEQLRLFFINNVSKFYDDLLKWGFLEWRGEETNPHCSLIIERMSAQRSNIEKPEE